MRRRSKRYTVWIAALAGLTLLAVIQNTSPNGIQVSPSAIFHPPAEHAQP